MAAVADAPVDETVVVTTSKRPTIQVNVTDELKTLIEERAKSEELSTSAWMARLAATTFGYDSPVSTRTRVRKYGSVEERKAANAARQREKNEAVNKLIEAAKSGAIAADALDPTVRKLLGI